MADFYSDAAAQRLKMLDAEKAAHLADLAAHRANGDTESAATTVQQLANNEAERANLANLYNAYVQSQQAPQAERLTDEERNAKPWDKMTVEDAYQLAKSGSRYGIDDAKFREGLSEVQRRRSRGE